MAYTTIDDPSAHFQVKIYTDADATTDDTTSQTFDGNSDLQPDWIWFKSRNVTGNHGSMDTSRGLNKVLKQNASNAEATSVSGYDLTAMNSNGFSYGRANQLDWAHDTPAQNVVHAWKANGGTRTTNTESGNNPGGGYQANTTAGFSIVDYTGTGAEGTMAHGLGVAPTVVIIKGRDDGHAWIIGHIGLGSNFENDLLFNSDAKADDDNSFGDTAPTSSVFTVKDAGGTNKDGEKYIAYCFAPIQGYSKFGSYTGNGNADGTFVYTGFSPAWVMVKRTDSGNNWHMHDNKRVPYNSNNKTLYANLTNTEGTEDFDMLSNGFKLRESGGGYNASGGTYIYMAFAHHPFVSSEGVPTTAR